MRSFDQTVYLPVDEGARFDAVGGGAFKTTASVSASATSAVAIGVGGGGAGQKRERETGTTTATAGDVVVLRKRQLRLEDVLGPRPRSSNAAAVGGGGGVGGGRLEAAPLLPTAALEEDLKFLAEAAFMLD